MAKPYVVDRVMRIRGKQLTNSNAEEVVEWAQKYPLSELGVKSLATTLHKDGYLTVAMTKMYTLQMMNDGDWLCISVLGVQIVGDEVWKAFSS